MPFIYMCRATCNMSLLSLIYYTWVLLLLFTASPKHLYTDRRCKRDLLNYDNTTLREVIIWSTVHLQQLLLYIDSDLSEYVIDYCAFTVL